MSTTINKGNEVVLSQAQFDAKKEAGTLVSGTTYKIKSAINILYAGVNTTGATIDNIANYRFIYIAVKYNDKWSSMALPTDFIQDEISLYNTFTATTLAQTLGIDVKFNSATSIDVSVSSGSGYFWCIVYGIL